MIDGIDESIEGKHVLIVDDILDSGGTLKLIRAELSKRNPASLRACVLLRKQRPSAMATPCEYVGFDIPDVFVVGYGLDFDNYYRNLPVIGTLREEAMGPVASPGAPRRARGRQRPRTCRPSGSNRHCRPAPSLMTRSSSFSCGRACCTWDSRRWRA